MTTSSSVNGGGNSQHHSPQNETPSRSWFPLGYKDGFCQWWANSDPAKAEKAVLSFLPHIRNVASPDDATHSENESVADPYGPRQWSSTLVPLSGENRALNEFSVSRVNESVENALVILHGYGAGLGFFYQNFEPLSRATGWKLFALDMLGMGRSSRPAFRIRAQDNEGKIKEAENWFIDSLEEWRIYRGLDRFTLIGHSMGGYMAVAYALKYPGRLNRLILASPIGIPEDPYETSAKMLDKQTSNLRNEFTQDQELTTTRRNKDIKKDNVSQPPRKPLPKLITRLWDANVSPFSVIRWSGPLGPRIVSGWTARRFSHLPPVQAQALHEYSYSIFRQRGSGEYAMPLILAPGAFARSPLIRRIDGLGKVSVRGDVVDNDTDKRIVEEPSVSCRVPVLLLYGENDWMDADGGYAAAKKINDAIKTSTQKSASENHDERPDDLARVKIIPGAGHHLYLDNAMEFNSIILTEMGLVKNQKNLHHT